MIMYTVWYVVYVKSIIDAAPLHGVIVICVFIYRLVLGFAVSCYLLAS